MPFKLGFFNIHHIHGVQNILFPELGLLVISLTFSTIIPPEWRPLFFNIHYIHGVQNILFPELGLLAISLTFSTIIPPETEYAIFLTPRDFNFSMQC